MKTELMPGTLEMLILKTLTRGVMHGYGIAQHIQQISDDVLQVEEGSLYPALQRLLIKGWVAAEWGHSANNRRARYYRLTPAGRPKSKMPRLSRKNSRFSGKNKGNRVRLICCSSTSTWAKSVL